MSSKMTIQIPEHMELIQQNVMWEQYCRKNFLFVYGSFTYDDNDDEDDDDDDDDKG
jgi:hypothetical protein